MKKSVDRESVRQSLEDFRLALSGFNAAYSMEEEVFVLELLIAEQEGVGYAPAVELGVGCIKRMLIRYSLICMIRMQLASIDFWLSPEGQGFLRFAEER